MVRKLIFAYFVAKPSLTRLFRELILAYFLFCVTDEAKD